MKAEEYKNALAGKQIPLLTLDNKWHQLFTQVNSTPEINRLENRLNELLKRQGKANTESKDIKKLKNTLMKEIMLIADGLVQNPDSEKLEKDMEEHKRLIAECNAKLEQYEEDLLELPREINQTNRDLMLASMDVCYKRIQANNREIDAISEWIKEIRRELKKKMVRKQETEAMNNALYAYMHDIFGADVIEIFDMQYQKSGTNNPFGKNGMIKKLGSKTKKQKNQDNAPES